jgi:glutathione S-transferase
MILIGQYDSPFVRRVAITLSLYGMAFEHRPWSVFGDADKVAAYSPAKRVPILVLDDGEVLIDSAVILDALDQMAGWKVALTPSEGQARREVLKVCALAGSLGDKAVALVYERLLHEVTSQAWIDRCRGQISGILDALEADLAPRQPDWWFGPEIGQADITVACVLRFVGQAHADVFNLADWPALRTLSERCEALDVFQTHQQTFYVVPPKG